jgi:hypothetical protein
MLAGLATGFGLQCITSLLIAPVAFGGYLVHVESLFSGRKEVLQVTLGHVLAFLFGGSYWIEAVLIMGLVAAVIMALSMMEIRCLIITVGIAVSLLSAPYAWSHDQVLLLPFLLLKSARLDRRHMIWTCLWVFVASLGCWLVLQADLARNEMYMIVIPIGFLIWGILRSPFNQPDCENAAVR